MSRFLQKFLLVLGVIALLFLLVEIGASLAATQQGSTPARIDHVATGPYRFTVSLYDDPARAGFTLPFVIAPQGKTSGQWIYQVTSIPEGKLTATPVRDSLSPDPHIPGGVQGAAEITVQGPWNLQVMVDGPAGQQTFTVPVTAVTLPPLPIWLGWGLGFLPVYGSLVFLWMQSKDQRMRRYVKGWKRYACRQKTSLIKEIRT